ncbi:MAG: hypothetical protein HYZ27_11710 [Deltaproteobacteria bacterium]|nr:hypothetical protein [Deltaproteobacteria bacterium]
MPDDDYRVEPRERLVGRGIGTTPERIDELRQQADAAARTTRKKPERSFAQVIDGAGQAAATPVTPKEKRRRALPKKGPRPSLAHPSQRDAYGREDESEEPVVVKG